MSQPDNNHKSLFSKIIYLISSREYRTAHELISNLDIETYNPEIKGKIYAWQAQCFFELKQPHKAIISFNHAIRNAKRLGHKEAVAALREQRNLATAQATALDVANNSNQTDPISNALRISKDNPQMALEMLNEHLSKLEGEDQLRNNIICLLAIARLSNPSAPVLEKALKIAMNANDPNLITAVKQTMDQLGYQVKPHTF